jgi:hypothetical protein
LLKWRTPGSIFFRWRNLAEKPGWPENLIGLVGREARSISKCVSYFTVNGYHLRLHCMRNATLLRPRHFNIVRYIRR